MIKENDTNTNFGITTKDKRGWYQHWLWHRNKRWRADINTDFDIGTKDKEPISTVTLINIKWGRAKLEGFLGEDFGGLHLYLELCLLFLKRLKQNILHWHIKSYYFSNLKNIKHISKYRRNSL